ncbi:MAG TPA: hypothetical protein VM733_06385, partial [Thermoanaerobaculia bacterium]|nr:hypothetical protein [Thermoanaerobaculia bacterium]
HLDLDQRQFTFEVPNVEAESARILIRAGNEGREIELESPQTFVIHQDRARALAEAPLDVVEEKRGEPAREGDRGVIEWIDGNRDGSHLAARSALRHPLTLDAAPAFRPAFDSVEQPGGQTVRARRAVTSRFPAPTTFLLARLAPRHCRGRDVLLAYRRLNI